MAPELVTSTIGLLAIGVFAVAYGFVIAEEVIGLRKSKPVILASGLIWVMAAAAYAAQDRVDLAIELLRENLREFAELLLFLLSAMTYINTIEERGVFKVLSTWLVAKRWSLQVIYWMSGLLAFFISPVADNLTTALVMGAAVLSVGRGQPRFLTAACINIVVAANAGGAFSPFGDITTLMVWQQGLVRFEEFFALFLPSLVNWLLPATLIAFSVPHARPAVAADATHVKRGGWIVVGLLFATIAMTVALHHVLHLPPFLGMMTGLGLLKVYGYFIRRGEMEGWLADGLEVHEGYKPAAKPFDIFISMKRIEWDTLMFFYGILLCVGGLAAFGYLALGSRLLYTDLGATAANILVGLVSAVVDNIPIMYAVLTVSPEMPLGEWLLVTLTAGVGGSLLSIGSAAGVALMGQARGVYTFFSHLRWTWAIALGYAASIWTHLALNASLFTPA